MPDRRRHRGPHPEDARLFASAAWPTLRRAVADLAWLLDRGYAKRSALKLVGDRYNLTQRQRIAVKRCTCTDDALALRRRRHAEAASLRGATLLIDGFNVLTTVEAALAGGVLLRGRDRCLRDMASMHGHYRKVAETLPAATHVGRTLEALGVADIHWLLDRPVSNSGRLKAALQQLADAHNWPWRIDLADDVDRSLIDADATVATADSAVLDGCRRWFDLSSRVVADHLPTARVIDLADEAGD